ncbi:MAG TPA: hypothetical protein VLV50_10865 [Stellaceae bacterium]|nr:hypothetical protein [Stellaceae bacterium]
MPELYVATNGLSVWKSGDLGETIARMPSGTNLYSGSQVWSLASHPADPRHVYAGTDSGLYRLDRAEGRWTHIASPMDEERLVTAIALAPRDPNLIFCGTQPSCLYRSGDGGKSWRKIETAMKRFTTSGFYGSERPGFADDGGNGGVKHWTRVTQMALAEDDPSLVWAGVEIDGAWASRDGGMSFARVADGLTTDDIHGFCVTTRGGRTLFATTNAGLHVSRDDGQSWRLAKIDSPWQYVRSILARPDGSGVMFMTNGNGPPGTGGRLFRSRDGGESWANVPLDPAPDSSLYFLAAHPADPNLIFAAATLGRLYRSTDGGESWVGLKARLPEIRALLWVP